MSYTATNSNGTAKIRSMGILDFSQRKDNIVEPSNLSNIFWPWNSALLSAQGEVRHVWEEYWNE